MNSEHEKTVAKIEESGLVGRDLAVVVDWCVNYLFVDDEDFDVEEFLEALNMDEQELDWLLNG